MTRWKHTGSVSQSVLSPHLENRSRARPRAEARPRLVRFAWVRAARRRLRREARPARLEAGLARVWGARR